MRYFTVVSTTLITFLSIVFVDWGLVTLPLLWRFTRFFPHICTFFTFHFLPLMMSVSIHQFFVSPYCHTLRVCRVNLIVSSFLWWVFMSFVDSLSAQYHCVNLVLQVFIRFPPPTLLRCVVNFFAIQAGPNHACLLVSSRSVCSLLMSSSPLHSLFLVLSISTYRYGIRLRCEKHGSVVGYDLVCSQYPGRVTAPDRHLVSSFLRCFSPIADGCGMQHSGLRFSVFPWCVRFWWRLKCTFLFCWCFWQLQLWNSRCLDLAVSALLVAMLVRSLLTLGDG